MREIPYFQENILENIINHFNFYLFYIPWMYGALFVCVFVYLNYLVISRKQQNFYTGLFPQEKYVFDISDKSSIFALFCLIVVLVVYSINIYNLDDTIFNNLDLMNLGTIVAMKNGVMPTIYNVRFSPISFFDVNFVYAVTHNFNLINIYTIIKQLLIAYLLYSLFDYVSVTKRLYTIAVICFMPVMFWINNIVFPEQLLIIFILLSFISLKKYSSEKNNKYLLWFAIFMNISLYTKESTILLYSGILIASLFYNIWTKKITFASFKKPFGLIKSLPIEYMVFVSSLVFVFFYYINTGIYDENSYVNMHQNDIFSLIIIYWLEILIVLFAINVFIRKVENKKLDDSAIFNEGLLIGSVLIVFFIVFKYQMAPFPEHKTYYLVLPVIFSMWYIIQTLSNKKIFMLYLFIIFASLITNYSFYKKEAGKDLRAATEFFINEIKDSERAAMFISNISAENTWFVECMSTSYKYYFPDKNIIFKTPHYITPYAKDTFENTISDGKRMYHDIIQAGPEYGDYILINKSKEKVPNIKTIYENDKFAICVK